jgi:hypothetical protein
LGRVGEGIRLRKLQVHFRYFKWNSEFELDDIKLGDNIGDLIRNGIVKYQDKGNGKDYRYSSDNRVYIGVKNGCVNSIFFTQKSGNSLIGVNADEFSYPATEKIAMELSRHFEYLNDYKSFKDFEKLAEGDYLQLVFRDHELNCFFIRRV